MIFSEKRQQGKEFRGGKLEKIQSRKISQEGLRLLGLTSVFGGTLLALGWGMLTPVATQNNPVNNFTFPANIPLAGWQQMMSSEIAPTPNNRVQPIAAQRYQYRQKDLLLEIEMRYLRVNNGEVNELLRAYTSVPATLVTNRAENLGDYGLLVDGQRVYLSACINPRGESTVTSAQYLRNKFLADVSLTRLSSWLLGRDKLIDNRCLWANLSLRSPQTPTPDLYPSLQKVWANWHQWWQPRFPQIND